MAQSDDYRGTLSLVLGILSILGGGLFGVLAPFLGIPAWMLGGQVLRERPRSDPQVGLARAGRCCGGIGLFLAFGWLVLLALYLALGVSVLAAIGLSHP